MNYYIFLLIFLYLISYSYSKEECSGTCFEYWDKIAKKSRNISSDQNNSLADIKRNLQDVKTKLGKLKKLKNAYEKNLSDTENQLGRLKNETAKMKNFNTPDELFTELTIEKIDEQAEMIETYYRNCKELKTELNYNASLPEMNKTNNELLETELNPPVLTLDVDKYNELIEKSKEFLSRVFIPVKNTNEIDDLDQLDSSDTKLLFDINNFKALLEVIKKLDEFLENLKNDETTNLLYDISVITSQLEDYKTKLYELKVAIDAEINMFGDVNVIEFADTLLSDKKPVYYKAVGDDSESNAFRILRRLAEGGSYLSRVSVPCQEESILHFFTHWDMLINNTNNEKL